MAQSSQPQLLAKPNTEQDLFWRNQRDNEGCSSACDSGYCSLRSSPEDPSPILACTLEAEAPYGVDSISCRNLELGRPKVSVSADRKKLMQHIFQQDISQYQDCPDPSCFRRGLVGFTSHEELQDHLRVFHEQFLSTSLASEPISNGAGFIRSRSFGNDAPVGGVAMSQIEESCAVQPVVNEDQTESKVDQGLHTTHSSMNTGFGMDKPKLNSDKVSIGAVTQPRRDQSHHVAKKVFWMSFKQKLCRMKKGRSAGSIKGTGDNHQKEILNRPATDLNSLRKHRARARNDKNQEKVTTQLETMHLKEDKNHTESLKPKQQVITWTGFQSKGGNENSKLLLNSPVLSVLTNPGKPYVSSIASTSFHSLGEISFVMSTISTSRTPYTETADMALLRENCAKEILQGYMLENANNRHMSQRGSHSASSTTVSSHSATNSRSRASTSTSLSSTSGTSLNHRKRQGDDDDESEMRRPRKPRATNSSPSGQSEILLACPFAKYDVQRYSERNDREKHYRGCSSSFLKDISRVKQHLYRVHRRPAYHCPRCFVTVLSSQELSDHLRDTFCVVATSPFEEKMTVDQETAIRRREMGKDVASAWFDIFRILFPSAPLPQSPYADSSVSESAAITNFLDYFQREGARILSTTTAPTIYGIGTDESTREFLQSILEQAISNLVQQYRGDVTAEPPFGLMQHS